MLDYETYLISRIFCRVAGVGKQKDNWKTMAVEEAYANFITAGSIHLQSLECEKFGENLEGYGKTRCAWKRSL